MKYDEYLQQCAAKGMQPESVNHPSHYTDHPSGVECIEITEHMNFNLGNAIKYIWRAGLKGKQLQDLEKAAWYINREIDRLSKNANDMTTDDMMRKLCDSNQNHTPSMGSNLDVEV